MRKHLLAQLKRVKRRKVVQISSHYIANAEYHSNNKIEKVVFIFRKFAGKCRRWSSFLEKLQRCFQLFRKEF